MLEKFNKEHTHTEDEVRFILQGSGVFHINPGDRPVFGIEVHAGDLISVPLGTRHWFDLCGDRRIRAIRLFQDTSGWTPHYLADGVHAGYEPLCLGPAWLRRRQRGEAGLVIVFDGRGILLDVEGTTSSISFVYDVLFALRQGADRRLSGGPRRRSRPCSSWRRRSRQRPGVADARRRSPPTPPGGAGRDRADESRRQRHGAQGAAGHDLAERL